MEDGREEGEVLPIEDTLKVDALAAIDDKDLSWFADLVNFLASGIFPPEFSKNKIN